MPKFLLDKGRFITVTKLLPPSFNLSTEGELVTVVAVVLVLVLYCPTVSELVATDVRSVEADCWYAYYETTFVKQKFR